jgi:L-gulonolactone oxidase
MNTTRWSNWSNRVKCHPSKLYQPSSESEIINLVSQANANSTSLRVAGSGHSFTELVPSREWLMNLKNYTGLTSINVKKGTATFRAGTQLSEVTESLFKKGFALENMGDIDKQSLAGALSTGTHGTGINFGVMSTQLTTINIVTPSRSLVQCTPDTNPELFKAAQVSLGSLGILTELTLELEPVYYLTEEFTKLPLETCLELIEELRANNRHFEFFWFPGTDTAIVKTLNKTSERNDLPDWTVGDIIENGLFDILCRIGNQVPAGVKWMNQLAAKGFSTSGRTGPGHRVFSSVRSVRFNEMEYGVPAPEGPSVIRDLRELINRKHRGVQFPVEYRYVQGDDIFLSPANGMDRAFIAVHKFHKKSYKSFFRDCESIFTQYRGRPHWGKIHFRNAQELKNLYPEWDRFQSIRKTLDPKGILMNDHLRKIFQIRS